MPIVKRGKDTWQVRIFLGRDENGKTRFFNQTVKGKRKDAVSLERKKIQELEAGVSIEHTKIIVNEYLDKWLELAARPRLRARTYDDYESYLNRYVRPLMGTRRLTSITPLDVQGIYTALSKRGLTARTIRYTHAILASAFKQAVRWQILHTNPAAMVELPKITRREMSVLSAEDCSLFLNAAKADRWYVIFSLAISTGMRPEEYLGLQWKDVDLVEGRVSIQRGLVWHRKGGGWTFEEPKTSKSRRTIPLPSTVGRELASHRRLQLEGRIRLGPAYQDFDLVFATEIGTPILTSNLTRRHFKPILKKAGLPMTIRLYDLRHTCATLLLQANTSPKVVAERLGHSTIVLTLDTYSHVLPTMQKDASDQLERMLYATAK
jgi:integrase